MTLLTPCSSSRRPRVLSLFVDTSFPQRTTRVSHVHRCTVTACRALRPRRCRTSLPLSPSAIGSSGLFKPSTLPKLVLNGAHSLQPKAYGLPPLCLRLTAPLPHDSPRLDTGCGGSPLPGRDFHPQVQQRLVAHEQQSKPRIASRKISCPGNERCNAQWNCLP